MKIRALALASSIVFSGFAFAQGDTAAAPSAASAAGYSDSEFMHQAPGGKFEVTPFLGIVSERVELKSTTADLQYSTFLLAARAEYGFTDMFSLSGNVGVGLGVNSVEDCPSGSVCNDDEKRSGLTDPTLGANLRFPVGPGAIRAGLDISFGVTDAKAGVLGPTNYSSGGIAIKPYAGYEITLGSNILGARAGYSILGDRDQVDQTNGDKEKEKDGNQFSLAVFYEYNFPRIVSLGASIEHMRSADTKSEASGVTTKNDNGYRLTTFRFYVPLKFNESVTLIPALSAGGFNHDGTTNVDTHTLAALECAARFTF